MLYLFNVESYFYFLLLDHGASRRSEILVFAVNKRREEDSGAISAEAGSLVANMCIRSEVPTRRELPRARNGPLRSLNAAPRTLHFDQFARSNKSLNHARPRTISVGKNHH